MSPTTRDPIPASLRQLEADALEAHAHSGLTHRRLKTAVQRENRRRLQRLEQVLSARGLGWCKGHNHFVQRDQMTLVIRDRREPFNGKVTALCPTCLAYQEEGPWPPYPRVRVFGSVLKYQPAGRKKWRQVPRGEQPGAALYLPIRINTRTAKRFGVLPTIKLDWRSAPAKIAPTLSLHEPIKHPYSTD